MNQELPAINNSLLELHVPDFNVVKDFYSILGFDVIWERKPEGFKGYLILKLEDNILCFWAGNDRVYEQDYFKQWGKDTKKGYGVEIVLMVDDINGLYENVKDKIQIFEKLQMRPWGLEDFRIEDPYGYYLRFTTKHNILDPKHAVK